MKKKDKIGLAPGSLVFVGSQKVQKVQIHCLSYDELELTETHSDNQNDFTFQDHPNKVDWIDVRGIHDVSLVDQIGQAFHVHPMVLEDVLDTSQRARFEEYEQGCFFIIKAISYNKELRKINQEQVSIYFTDEVLLSFQEDHSDVFEAVRKRINASRGLVRKRKCDYLAFGLLDNIVDHYFLVIDEFQEEIERLETEIIQKASENLREPIHFLRKEIKRMHKLVSPLREAVSRFSRADNPFIEKRNNIYFRDVHDLTIQVLERLEGQLDYLNGLQDLVISELSHKMNEVMKFLTIITTLFVPLSCLAGFRCEPHSC